MKEKFKEIDGSQYLVADPTIINDSNDVCFLIDRKHYRLSKGAITYDYNKKRYVLKSSIQVENGIIGIDKDDKPILGSWSWPKDHLLSDSILANYKTEKFLCISEDIFVKTNWEERLVDGEFYLKTYLPVKEFSKIKAVNRDVKAALPYNSASEIKKVKKVYNTKYKPEKYNNGITKFPQVLGSYTYGFEFETTKGMVPQRICNKLGLIPLRDGSIDGIEYVTIPLEGKNGIQTIIDSCMELNKRTVYTFDCALHIHVGGVPRTEEFFIALTKILCGVQEEMYSMFPFYTRGGFGLKKKDYTAPLPAVELMTLIDNNIDISNRKQVIENFKHVFEFLSMGHNYGDYKNNLDNVISHPSDPGGTNKWYVKSRYRWVNMIPLLFGNKETIEFRIHTPTYDANKIIYFAIICASLLDGAKRMAGKVLSGELKSYSIGDFVYRYLTQFGDKYAGMYEIINRYMQLRRSHNRALIQDKDFYGNEDKILLRDNLYSLEGDDFSYLTVDIKAMLQETRAEDLLGIRRDREGRPSPYFHDTPTFGFDPVRGREVPAPPVLWRTAARVPRPEDVLDGAINTARASGATTPGLEALHRRIQEERQAEEEQNAIVARDTV
ncbi:MAG: hypothetical protein ACSLE0_08190 [Chitinophagaceae bacterium]